MFRSAILPSWNGLFGCSFHVDQEVDNLPEHSIIFAVIMFGLDMLISTGAKFLFSYINQSKCK